MGIAQDFALVLFVTSSTTTLNADGSFTIQSDDVYEVKEVAPNTVRRYRYESLHYISKVSAFFEFGQRSLCWSYPSHL
jgi:hypothetical protein